MDHPASTTKARLGLRGIAVLALVGLFSLLLAPLASADVVVNNVVATGNGTITAGNSTSINYALINQNSQNSVDTVNSCNTAGTGRVFYTIGVPANVTANGVAGGAGVALQIEFSDCDVPIPVIFSSTTAGSYAINGTASGTGTLSDTADFTLVVNPPADSTKPTISITTPANGATYAPGQAVAASYSCADEAGGSGLKSCVGTVANGANIDTATLGQNSFTVTAKDNANNSDTKTVTYTVADTADPDTAITAQPDSLMSSADASFSFTGSDDVTAAGSLTFVCSLDGGTYAACSSPKSYSGLSDGSHTFSVVATDAAGNTDDTPASFTWTVDTTAPPEPTITSGPDSLTNATTAELVFSDTEAGVTFRCWLEETGTPSELCTSPATYQNLGDGVHTFKVKAVDAAGNESASVEYAWTIDTVAPVIAAHADVNASAVNASGATVSYTNPTATDNVDASVAVTCAPASGSLFPLGSTEVSCTAQDVAGNDAAPVTFDVIVADTTAPDTSIAPAPTSPTKQTSASFGFAGTDNVTTAAQLTFECSLDSLTAFAPCTSPKTYRGLTEGSHTFRVRAIDAAGNTDQTPASHTWIVDTTAPTFSGVPANIAVDVYNATSATVNYTAPTATDNVDTSVTVTCNPPSGTFAAGTTTVTCSATDAAGNTGSASFTVTVNAYTVTFIAPVKDGMINNFKVGSTLPIKVQIKDAAGNLVTGKTVTMKVSVGDATTESESTAVDVVSTSAAVDSGNSFRYDSVSGQYIYNLSTKVTPFGTALNAKYTLFVYVNGVKVGDVLLVSKK